MTKVMAGVHQLTVGQMLLDGKEVSFAAPSEGLSQGIVMVYQEHIWFLP